MVLILYRVTEHDPAAPIDFQSDGESQKYPKLAAHLKSGRSAWDDLGLAIRLAERQRTGERELGRTPTRLFVAQVDATDEPAGPSYAYQQGRNPHHFQLFGEKVALAAASVTAWCSWP